MRAWTPGAPERPRLGAAWFGGSSPSGATTTTQNTTPYAGQTSYLIGGTDSPGPAGGANAGKTVPGIFPEAANLFSNYSPQYFPTSTVEPFDPTQLVGQGLELGFGLGGTPAVNNAQGFFGNLESGDFLSAGNPYFAKMADTIKASVVPGLESQLTQGNNDNPGVAYGVSSGITNALAPLAYSNYQDTLGKMVQGGLIAPGLQSAQLQDVSAVQDVGAQRQAQAQAQRSDLVNRWNYYQQLPYQKLNMFGQQVSGNYGGTSTLTQPYFQNQLANILGAAFGANSVASTAGFGGSGSGFGSIPLFAMISSIFGG